MESSLLFEAQQGRIVDCLVCSARDITESRLVRIGFSFTARARWTGGVDVLELARIDGVVAKELGMEERNRRIPVLQDTHKWHYSLILHHLHSLPHLTISEGSV